MNQILQQFKGQSIRIVERCGVEMTRPHLGDPRVGQYYADRLWEELDWRESVSGETGVSYAARDGVAYRCARDEDGTVEFVQVIGPATRCACTDPSRHQPLGGCPECDGTGEQA